MLLLGDIIQQLLLGNTLHFSSADIRDIEHFIFKNVQLGGVCNGSTSTNLIGMSASPWLNTPIVEVDSCVMRVSGTSTASDIDVVSNAFTTAAIHIKNSLCIVDGYSGSASVRVSYIGGASASGIANNNTFRGFDTGIIQDSSATVSLGNNLFEGCTTDTSGTITSLGGNTTDNANFGGMTSTGNSVSQTYTFVASSSTLASSDVGAAELGVDLSADPNLPVSIDAFGLARPQNTLFDAGYHERVAVTRSITPSESSDVPAGTINVTLTGFDNPPTSAELNGISVSISNGTISAVDITLPALTDFVDGGSHAPTRWSTNQVLEVFENAESAVAQIQIDPPDTDGPTYYFGSATTPSGDSVFPAGTVAGDDYFIEVTAGTLSEVLDNGSISSTTGTYTVKSKVYDTSGTSWSTEDTVSFTPARVPNNTTHTFTDIEYTQKFNSIYKDGTEPDNNPYPTYGIPSPTWGVQDTRPSAPGDWSSEVAGNYYIDWTNGTDTARDYGTPSAPRKTLPRPLPAGAYVEIDGIYSESSAGAIWIEGNGTATAPIWIVGKAGTSPEFNNGSNTVVAYGSYIYLEDLKFDGAVSGACFQVSSTSTDDRASDHIMIKDCEITGNVDSGGGVSLTTTPSLLSNNYIVVGCNIHTLGPQVDADFDAHGISLGDGLTDVWVLGNTVSDTSGSGLQIGSGQTVNNCQRIYVGRNTVDNTRQAGLWAKAGKDVVFSQNIVHDIQDRCVGVDTSPSKGLGGQYRLDNVWYIFNTVYNCRYGIRVPSTSAGEGKSIYVIGNTISTIDGNLAGGACFDNDPDGSNNWDDAAIHIHGCDDRHIIDNTINEVVSGIHISTAGIGSTTTIRGNIVSNITGTNGYHFFSERSDGTVVEMDYNNWYDATGLIMKWGTNTYTTLAEYKVGTSHGVNDVEGDPIFTNTATRDFSLNAGSPAINSNRVSPVYDSYETTYLFNIEQDHDGTARKNTVRSIGAIEVI